MKWSPSPPKLGQKVEKQLNNINRPHAARSLRLPIAHPLPRLDHAVHVEEQLEDKSAESRGALVCYWHAGVSFFGGAKHGECFRHNTSDVSLVGCWA